MHSGIQQGRIISCSNTDVADALVYVEVLIGAGGEAGKNRVFAQVL